ncbi:hypothetical protein NBRC116494_28760 [Aurantivibrio plasticivorans]
MGELIFFCGKMGAGKSTMANQLASKAGAILISEDAWLAKLYPGEIDTFDDYLQFSARLKPLIKDLAISLLASGVTVILDFPGNTKTQRTWFRSILQAGEYPHRLIYLNADDDLCLDRLAIRREEQPERAAFDNEAVFKQVTQYFEPPSDDEGFQVDVIKP